MVIFVGQGALRSGTLIQFSLVRRVVGADSRLLDLLEPHADVCWTHWVLGGSCHSAPVLGLHFFSFTLSALDLHLSWVTLRAHSRAA